MSSINNYYELTKPGIVWSNTLAAAAGFLFAARGYISWPLLLFTLVGTALIVASACVFNNYLDRDIDAKMARTKSRALASDSIAPRTALVFATVLAVASIVLFAACVNTLALAAALIGFVVYIGLYTPLKRVTPHAVLVGAVAGAVPPVIGYAAVTGSLDAFALLLFFAMFAWQMPHFLAIANFRLEEYRAAGVPVFPLVHGLRKTAALSASYVFIFAAANVSLFVLRSEPVRLWLSLVAAVLWFVLAIRAGNGDRSRARMAFFYSLFVLLAWCLALAVP